MIRKRFGIVARSYPAFTVPELLAVVAIIAIILSIILPSFTAARWEANRAKCGSQMRQISVSTRAYSVDNNGMVIRARQNKVQIAIDPSEQILFARYGYPAAHWSCPSRNYKPQLEAAFANQLVLGYQYFGGIDQWTNAAGTRASHSPVNLKQARGRWVVAADASIKIDGVWGGGRDPAFEDLPSHKRNSPWPEGGNHTYVDGSAQWVPFDEMYMIHSWGGAARLCFFRQDDLPSGLVLSSLVSAKLHKP